MTIRGFGTFTATEHSARTVHNVQTGDRSVEVPARVLFKFKASQNLKDAVAEAHAEASREGIE